MKSKGSNLLGIILYLILFSSYSFFSIFVIIGAKAHQNSLLIYSLLLAIGGVYIYISSVKKYLFIQEIRIIFFCVFIIFSLLITSSINGIISDTSKDSLLDFCAVSVPSALCGIYVAKNSWLEKIIKNADRFVIFIVLTMTIILVNGYLNGLNRVGLTKYFNMDYQGISYFSAYGFFINLYQMLYGRKFLTSRVFSSRTYQIFRLLYLGILLTVSIYAGGRGGLVLIALSIVFVLFYELVIKKNSIRFIFVVVLLFILFEPISKVIMNNSIFYQSFLRVTEYFNQDGSINWDGTSGRKEIYDHAIALIKHSPLIGYGISGANYKGIKLAHNFFLDIMLEGGIIYLIFWLVLLYRLMKQLIRRIRYDEQYLIIFVFFACEFTNFMFSSIYLRNPIIWFTISFITIDKVMIKYSIRSG